MGDKEKRSRQVRLIHITTLLIFVGFSVFFFLATNGVIRLYAMRETQMYAVELEKELDSRMSADKIGAEDSEVLHLLRIYSALDELDLVITDRDGTAVNSAIEGIRPGESIFGEDSLLTSCQKQLTEDGIIRFTDGKWVRSGTPYRMFCIIKPVIGTDYRLIVLCRNRSIHRVVLQSFLVFTAVIAALYLLTIRFLNRILQGYRNKIVQLATIDELTGLVNRKSFIRQYEFMEANGELDGALLFMADIDLFKNVNDTYGHNVGDQALAFLAEKIRLFMNGKCIAGRWGGDEFIGVFVDGEKSAEEKLKMLLTEIRETPVRTPNGEELHITVSLGAAEIEPGMDLNANVERADEALYASKKNGRDRMTVRRRERSGK